MCHYTISLSSCGHVYFMMSADLCASRPLDAYGSDWAACEMCPFAVVEDIGELDWGCWECMEVLELDVEEL